MKRGAGILLHISSLPSSYGIGTLGNAAYEFVDFLQAAGQKYWQLLPIGPTGYGNSPYQSSTSFGGNPYFIDLDFLREDGLLKREELYLTQWGGDPRQVDYGLLYENRGKLLQRAFSRWNGSHETEYEIFFERNRWWLLDYAVFGALKERFGGSSWIDWPEDCRRQEDISRDTRESLQEAVNYHCFVQFLFFRQWEALRRYANQRGVSLMGDLPFYSSLDSADAWANSQQFQLDENRMPAAVAGVPPDYFSASGQIWGNPLYDWEYMRKDGYSWWIRRMKRATDLFDLVRIDHFRGLESYWAIPFGEADGRTGQWEKGPGMELIRRIWEEVPKAAVVAEDLGLLTPEVKRFVEQTGYPGMKVLQFAFDGDKNNPYLPEHCPENSVVYTGTHDNDTLAGWLSKMDPKKMKTIRKLLKAGDTEDLHGVILQRGCCCKGNLFIVPLQDYLRIGSAARMNIPGTLEGNWRWRMLPETLSERLAAEIKAYTQDARR